VDLNSSSGLSDSGEVTLEVMQAVTRDLRQQTLSLQEERERLVSARRELGKLQQELPVREKKTNTQVGKRRKTVTYLCLVIFGLPVHTRWSL
jgi:hypothetical protein